MVRGPKSGPSNLTQRRSPEKEEEEAAAAFVGLARESTTTRFWQSNNWTKFAEQNLLPETGTSDWILIMQQKG
jgi:hypothetical protein